MGHVAITMHPHPSNDSSGYKISSSSTQQLFELSTSTCIKGIVPRYKSWLPTNEPARAHAANENWAWQTANKFASRIQVCPLRLSLQWVWRLKHHVCSVALIYRFSYTLAAHSWRLWAFHLDHQQNVCAARFWLPHTPVHYTAILGVPIVPVPTLIEFLN